MAFNDSTVLQLLNDESAVVIQCHSESVSERLPFVAI